MANRQNNRVAPSRRNTEDVEYVEPQRVAAVDRTNDRTNNRSNKRAARDDVVARDTTDSAPARTRRSDAAAVDVVSQRRYYGGFNLGAAFFGWISATGVGVLLIAILGAVGSAVAVSSLNGRDAQNAINNGGYEAAKTVGLVSGGLLVLALVIAYYAGGYVAGRMSRFDGARQGFGTWVFGLVVVILLAAFGAIFGDQYNILQGLNLPHIPLGKETLNTAGIITSVLALVLTLLAAVSGGKVGERYHRKIDRVGYAD